MGQTPLKNDDKGKLVFLKLNRKEHRQTYYYLRNNEPCAPSYKVTQTTQL